MIRVLSLVLGITAISCRWIDVSQKVKGDDELKKGGCASESHLLGNYIRDDWWRTKDADQTAEKCLISCVDNPDCKYVELDSGSTRVGKRHPQKDTPTPYCFLFSKLCESPDVLTDKNEDTSSAWYWIKTEQAQRISIEEYKRTLITRVFS